MGGANFHYTTYSETLKNLLLHNASMNFIVIWYGCSLGGPLLDSLKKYWSDKKHGCRGEANFHYITYSETFKKILLQYGSMDFIVIWYECSLGGPLLDSLKKNWSDKKHGRHFHYVTYSETLKNLFLYNASMDFIVIKDECSLGGPLLDSLK